MKLIQAYNQIAELKAVARNIQVANCAIAEYQEAAEENYHLALAKATKWQETFDIALQLRYLEVAHEAFLCRNACKEEARKLKAFIAAPMAFFPFIRVTTQWSFLPKLKL